MNRRFSLKFLLLATLGLLLAACGKTEAENLSPDPDPPAEVGRDFKVIHVFVALCDNASQGIAPVPSKIGNGDDPANNLYWGCIDGSRPVFSKSKFWTRLSVGKVDARPEILERLVFQHQKTKAILVVDAWRGKEIQSCLSEFRKSLAGQHYESVKLNRDGPECRVNLAGGADLLAFIGHNGLMEFQVPGHLANPKRKQPVDAVLLCCKSRDYFSDHLKTAGAKPAVMTASNMYPGAFILHDVLEAWFVGGDSGALRMAAAKAYAKNQGISTKGALNVFADLH